MKHGIIKKLLCLTLAAALLFGAVPVVEAAFVGSAAGDGMGIVAHGVDLSSWQGEAVDFDKIKAQGFDFVILRAGFSNTRDAVFERNYSAAKAAGLDVGVYIYSYAATPEAARREAESCKQWLAGKQLEYPVYFDLEDPEVHGGMSVSALTELAETFLSSLAADGWLVGLYSCRSWLEGKIDTQSLGQSYECWMAQYWASGTCDAYEQYHDICGMWQYSASGDVEGIPGQADLDVAFKDYPALCRENGLNGYEAEGETLYLRAADYAKVIRRGESLALSGTVVSREGALEHVTVAVVNADKRSVLRAEFSPNVEQWSLAAASERLKTGTLSEGEYTLRVTAETAQSERLLLNESIAVTPDGLWLTGLSLPQKLRVGQRFFLSGTVTAAAPMVSLTVEVLSEDGTAVFFAECAPNEREYDLSQLNAYPRMTEKGSYTLKITAKTETDTRTAVTEPFRVWVASDPIAVEGFELAETYLPGELTGLMGTLTSQNSDMSVTVVLRDADGEQLYSAQFDGNRTVDLSRFDRLLPLAELPLGYYECEITATNDAGPTVVSRKTFTVMRDAMSLCGANIPSVLRRGDTYALRGAVASELSALRHVSAAIIDERGVPVFAAAYSPNRGVFALEDCNASLLFSELGAGKYRLRICAENEAESAVLCDCPFTVTEEAPVAVWEGEHVAMQGLCYAAGDVGGCYGTLTADEPITELRAAVYAEDGTLVAACTAPVGETSVSASVLNEQLRLSALTEGAYRLEITAVCGERRTTVFDESFSVSACAHAHTRGGNAYAADCTAVGAVCATRCMSCGEAVAAGKYIPKTEHNMTDGACALCEKTAPKSVPVAQTSSQLTADDRYLLAAEVDGLWYAIDASGGTVCLGEAVTAVDASLLWSVEPQRDGTVVFRNCLGLPLHADTTSLCAAAGRTNTAFTVTRYRDGYVLCCGEASVAVDECVFRPASAATRLKIFSYLAAGAGT